MTHVSTRVSFPQLQQILDIVKEYETNVHAALGQFNHQSVHPHYLIDDWPVGSAVTHLSLEREV